MLPPESVVEEVIGAELGIALGVAIAYLPVDPSGLSPRERLRLKSLDGSPKVGAWMRGRSALKRLLARLGEPDDTADIEFPSPRWSLTHSGGAAVAVAATGSTLEGIGVDLELGRGPSPKAERLFLIDNERRALADDGPAARLRLWTIKEALYKANSRNSETWFTDYEVAEPGRSAGIAWLTLGAEPVAMRYASLELSGGCLTVAISAGRTS